MTTGRSRPGAATAFVMGLLATLGCGSGGGNKAGASGTETSGGTSGSRGGPGTGGVATSGTGSMTVVDAAVAPPPRGESDSGETGGAGGSAAVAADAGIDAAAGASGSNGPLKRYIYAGTGSKVSVYDMDAGHHLVKTINFPGTSGEIAGICANVGLHAFFVFFNSEPGRVVATDLLDDKQLWSKATSPSADRGDVSIDGTKLFVPGGEQSEVPMETVLDPKTGNQIGQFTLTPKVHDTDVGISGRYAYLETKSSPIVSVVDIASNQIVRQLKFGDVAGPHAVNGSDTLVVANVFQFFGFEMADVTTGQVVARVHAEGVRDPGNPAPAALRNHAIAWKPDETEVWLGSKYDPNLFVFDMTVMPPTQKRRITVGGGYHTTHWITFSIDGHFVYPSPDQNSGTQVQIFDSATYQPVATMGYSEHVMEVDFAPDGRVVAVGSQYGIGRKASR
jgi:WD40 repeat protein